MRRTVLVAMGAAMLLAPASAAAAVIRVDTRSDEHAADNGRCALREAITAANLDGAAPASGCAQGSGFDTVLVPGGVFVLGLSGAEEDDNVSGDLDISDVVTIRPAAPLAQVIIDGNNGTRVMESSAAGSGIRLVDLTVRNGNSPFNGGGIFNADVLTLDGVTVGGNLSSGAGGGIANSGADLTVVNSTISGNEADSDGGGIANFGPGAQSLTVRNATIAGNRADFDDNGSGDGGGISREIVALDLSLQDTIIAGNADLGGQAHDCDGGGASIASQGFNLIGSTAGCSYVPGPGDRINVAPQLLDLAFNGGATKTHALAAGSPAVNRGDNATCNRPDQRGVPRFRRCDIGAYERRSCRGVEVNRVGTQVRDVLRGTGRADGFLSFGGRDALRGLGGPDAFCAGRGNDRAYGGRGSDRMLGQAGHDRLFGGPGHDRAFGGPGRDLLIGSAGRDRLFGGAGRDTLRGLAGRPDRCFGAPGRDVRRAPGCEIRRSIP